MEKILRDAVFVAGGQPTYTYIDREDQDVERNFARAVATPNKVVSLSGPSKTGKTVLCRKMLSNREYIWIDGGRIDGIESFWQFIASEFNVPTQFEVSYKQEDSATVGLNTVISANGSQLARTRKTESHQIDGITSAIDALLRDGIILVIDDFHYIKADLRKSIIRNIKGAVFNGLKIVLLSVTHRAFDAIKDESELTGRFITVSLPDWNDDELRKIPISGFKVLNASCSNEVINHIVKESQRNPFLMQQFCWEICFDNEIEDNLTGKGKSILDTNQLKPMYIRLAKDAGLPIYQKLAAGPQSRKERARRPLTGGGDADIYEATLRALAETGPKSTVNYDEIRTILGSLLSDLIPQKHEVTSALKHLTAISQGMASDSAIDWDEDSREVTIADPYLRFYLRWQIKKSGNE
ncbi:MAG: hypothetical protein AB7O39_15925 [Flavobacteriaceae bacterium]